MSYSEVPKPHLNPPKYKVSQQAFYSTGLQVAYVIAIHYNPSYLTVSLKKFLFHSVFNVNMCAVIG